MENSELQISDVLFTIGEVAFKVADAIQLVSAIIALTGLAFIAVQIRSASRANRITSLAASYTLISQIQMFIYNNPKYLKFWCGGTRYKNIAMLSEEELSDLAAKDMILDTIEFLFLAESEQPAHTFDLVGRLMRNPEVRDFLKSEVRGSFRAEFERAIRMHIDRLENGQDQSSSTSKMD